MRTLLALVVVGSIGTADAQPTPPPPAKMAPVDQYLGTSRDAEIALARSAAPASISDHATIKVLTKHGYETAVDGSNGFVCLVDRSWQATVDDPELWNPTVRSPVCFNPPAVRSVLPFEDQLTSLALSGATREQIGARMKAAIAAKTFGPETGAMAYMLSKDQHLNERDGHWHPHLMFFYPGAVDAAALGANLPASPVLGGAQVVANVGTMPFSVFYVPLDHWSDGTAAAIHDH